MFCASSPIWWQARHRPKACWPLAASCAAAVAAEASISAAATIIDLIIAFSFRHPVARAVQAGGAQRVNGQNRRPAVPCYSQAHGLGARSVGDAWMTVVMPQSDGAVLARRAEIVAVLKRLVPGEGVIASEQAMRPYESDGLTAYRQLPMVVVLPETTEQVAGVLSYCYREGIKVVPRGAGTSLSGGALPLGDGVVLGMAKFSRIREIDLPNRVVVVEPGVTNLAVSQAVADAGFYYAPDPSSQIACTIGGNVAENSGGVHCLKYGVTTNNVLGCELVLMNGEVLRLGGSHLDSARYDLLGIVAGSEGLTGGVTEVTVRILKKPETARAALIGFLS